MAKKKGGKKGKKAKGPKSDVTNLERETFRFAIKTLESRLVARKERCLKLQEAIDVYRDAAEREQNEKETIFQNMREAMKRALLLKDEYTEALTTTRDRQSQEIKTMNDRIDELKEQIVESRESLEREISELGEKLSSLEDFKSNIEKIKLMIQEADERTAQELMEFHENVRVANDEALDKLHCLKEHLSTVLIEEKSWEFQQNLLESLDPVYVEAIKQSSRIAESVRLMSEMERQMMQENENLRRNIRELNRSCIEKAELERHEILYFQVRRKVLAALQEKLREQKIAMDSVDRIQDDMQCHAFAIDSLEGVIKRARCEMQRLQEELLRNEKIINKEMEARKYEAHLHQQMSCVLRVALEFIGQDVLSIFSEDEGDDQPLLLDSLAELLKGAVEEIDDQLAEAIDYEKSYVFDHANELQRYRIGNIGTLPASTRSALSLRIPSEKNRSIAKGTDETVAQITGCGNRSTIMVCDLISARILTETGLYSKYENEMKLQFSTSED